MNDRELMQQALDALESKYIVNSGAWRVEQDQAVTALRDRLAQTEQEPVAWMFQHEETGRTMCVDTQQLESGFEKGNPRLKKIAPLYTNPRRQWVSLTDEEIDHAAEQSDNYASFIAGALFAQDKLKEKNT